MRKGDQATSIAEIVAALEEKRAALRLADCHAEPIAETVDGGDELGIVLWRERRCRTGRRGGLGGVQRLVIERASSSSFNVPARATASTIRPATVFEIDAA